MPEDEEKEKEIDRLLNAFRRVVVRDGREEDHMKRVESLLKKINNKLWALLICVVVLVITIIVIQ